MEWRGVFPAITTPFSSDDSIDHGFLATYVDRMVRAGCRGIVPLGSLGEGNTLSFDEKVAVLETVKRAIGSRAALCPGIAALSTREAVRLAKASAEKGATGLMVLPPYVYRGDKRETRAHFDAVISATGLPCMLYNNPVAYGTDVLPEDVAELADAHSNLVAVKESSTDVRRITAIRALVKNRLAIFVGVDDLVLEGVAAGAVGWVAGLVDAFPEESVRLFDLAMAGRTHEARQLYEWFLPLLRFDTVPKFVQLIKLVQHEVGLGSDRVRAPRLELVGSEREAALSVIREALETRPKI